MTEETGSPDGAGRRPGVEANTDLAALAAATADEVRSFLSTVTEVAAGTAPEASLPLLLLAVSDLLAAGARLGATTDVVPDERFEPDAGPDPDVEALRANLANVFEGIDEYHDVVDPVLGPESEQYTVSGELVAIAQAVGLGLRHYQIGQPTEALWWWQFSYLSDWGARAASVLGIVQSILGHLRLDVDDDVAAEAEYDALQP